MCSEQGATRRGVPLMMGANNTSNDPGHAAVHDNATLYLCRQGERWVVVIESPLVRGALRLHHEGRDLYDARFVLLSCARRACPDAAIVSTDGALEGADWEWRLDVQRIEARAGDIGLALHREISARPRPDPRRPSPRQVVRQCHWGRFPEVSGRPRSF
jgi:hypothetical protein